MDGVVHGIDAYLFGYRIQLHQAADIVNLIILEHTDESPGYPGQEYVSVWLAGLLEGDDHLVVLIHDSIAEIAASIRMVNPVSQQGIIPVPSDVDLVQDSDDERA